MRLWESLHHLLDPNSHTVEEVAAYRQIGGQVLDVLERLNKTTPPGEAVAYIQVARCLELFADGLVGPYLEEKAPGPMSDWIRSQALALYRPIPELVTAAKQEAIDPGGARDLDLPWILKGRVTGATHEGAAGLRAYGGAVKSVMDWVEVALQTGPTVKQAQLYFAEATTNYDSASHLLWGFRDQPASTGTVQSLDDYLWTAVAYALGAIEEQMCPGVMEGLDIDTVLEGAEVGEGHLQVLRSRSGHPEVVRDIARQWREVMRDDSPHHHHEHHHHRDWD